MSFSDYEEMSVTGPEQEEGADLMDLMALTDNPAGCAIRQEEEQDIQNAMLFLHLSLSHFSPC